MSLSYNRYQKLFRPTFYYKDPNGNKLGELRAGGMILYIMIDYDGNILDEPEFLMIKNSRGYEDFGGCTDIADKSIEDTIARETFEESNGVLSHQYLARKMRQKKGLYIAFNQRSKYLTYICETRQKYDVELFGNWETHDDIPRTVEWVPLRKLLDSEFISTRLQWRLRYAEFFKVVTSISSTHKQLCIAKKSS